jgi:hypothetical protein
MRWSVPRAGLNWLHHNYLGPEALACAVLAYAPRGVPR